LNSNGVNGNSGLRLRYVDDKASSTVVGVGYHDGVLSSRDAYKVLKGITGVPEVGIGKSTSSDVQVDASAVLTKTRSVGNVRHDHEGSLGLGNRNG
jgi:hypothetical protein